MTLLIDYYIWFEMTLVIDYYIWFKMTLDIDYYIWFKITFDIYPKNFYVSHILILVSQMTVQEPTQSWAVYCYFAVTCLLLRAQKLRQAVVSCNCTWGSHLMFRFGIH